MLDKLSGETALTLSGETALTLSGETALTLSGETALEPQRRIFSSSELTKFGAQESSEPGLLRMRQLLRLKLRMPAPASAQSSSGRHLGTPLASSFAAMLVGDGNDSS